MIIIDNFLMIFFFFFKDQEKKIKLNHFIFNATFFLLTEETVLWMIMKLLNANTTHQWLNASSGPNIAAKTSC